jgi:hypothetical protein
MPELMLTGIPTVHTSGTLKVVLEPSSTVTVARRLQIPLKATLFLKGLDRYPM